METINLKNGLLEARFLPTQGMQLVSFRRGELEILNQPGCPIGPHFGERHPGILPPSQQGHKDPFFHGIARYAPWKAQLVDQTLQARISGKDEWNGSTLASLEGQSFIMEMTASLRPDTLAIELSVVGDSDSLVGLGCAFALPENRGRITGDFQGEGREIDLVGDADQLFHTQMHPLHTHLVLDAVAYQLRIGIFCQNAENSWLLQHQKGSGRVAISPVSAKAPHRPVLTVNSLRIELSF